MNLTGRDIQTLSLIGGFGFAVTSHVIGLLYPSYKSGIRRLNFLVKSGYLSCLKQPAMDIGRPEHIYYVSAKGANEIGMEKNVAPNIKEINHSLMINSLEYCLRRACLSSGLKVNCIRDRYLKENRRFEQYITKNWEGVDVMFPDLVFYLENTEGKKLLFFAEIDRTISISNSAGTSIKDKVAVMSKYFDNYIYKFFNDIFEYDFHGFRYLISTRGEKDRIDKIISLHSNTNQNYDFIWLVNMDKITADTIFKPIWRKLTPSDKNLYSII